MVRKIPVKIYFKIILENLDILLSLIFFFVLLDILIVFCVNFKHFLMCRFFLCNKV